MELKWEDAAVTGPVVFSRDVFDKFTLAPNIKELYALLHSSDAAEAKTVKCDEDSGVINTLVSDEASSECKPTENRVKPKPMKTTEIPPFPEPLVPYPCFTSINMRQRRLYIHMLNGNTTKCSKPLMDRVKNEVTEFMKYLQDVSRTCADVYNYMPPGSTRYSEEYFTACLEHMTSYPQYYSIQEITSLTSGKFVCEMSLNFEKQLLAMGKIDMLDKKVIPENTQLAGDYETVSNVFPPAKKAPSAQTAISNDSNAEKLSATYEPQVCLSKEAFIQLLNNSSELTEAWELPIWVKMNPNKGSSQSKTAYIDPPLLKTEMSWRERSLLFHEESIKLTFKKTVSRPVFFLTSEEISLEMNPPPEDKNSRNVVAFDDAGMDFETDLTDLESFGESYKPSKKVKEQNEPKTTCANSFQLIQSPKKQTDTQEKSKHTSTSQNTPTKPLELTVAEEQGETVSSLAYGGNGAMHESASEDSKVSSVQCPPTKRPRGMMEDKGDQDSDSDEERLVIDHTVSSKTQVTPGEVSFPRASDPATTSPTNPLGKGTKKGIKRPRISGECDPLGQILRMQDAMLKSTPSKNQEAVKGPVPEDKPPEPKTHSLVKQCVTSYLESREGQGEDGALPAAVPVLVAPHRKRLLREDLQASAEDEMDYDPPAEGSVLYKLYSLLDVLLMVRSSVNIAHPRHDRETFRAVPVHVLPKLEYQLCYGAESLTHTEACQLWAEKLLHSSTVPFISRINAHTSEVVQMQKLPDDWIQNITCDFKPTRCLNTLHHLLKKVSALQEGQYLLVHKPREGFVTIFKATSETKAARSLYHMQTAHCGLPAVSPGVPWVPLDPLHVLPFHQQHNRPPCTFPPRPPAQAKVRKGPKQPASSTKTGDKQKKKKKKKAQEWKDNMRARLLNDLQKSQNQSGEDGKKPS
ncbi:little elongation complex subunit 2 isoform X1 [Pimephales promelas]|uniref:little elongation complex subunit 2 isoform X1 n=1 Tax=Pimephales promelas TaxID=90988 RepID=UPI0019556578|nr:little elongation complex subunit 2 isoform X1 [Pimephales promelas]KAG1939343.1 little elongation complex subunit [Pimephales promelas]